MARDPGSPAIYKAAGYDFVFIDMEHGSYSMETVADMIRGAKSVGIGTVIRVPRLETFFISRVLDAGAEGIMVPMTSTREDAEAIARFSKYTPIGQRGFGSSSGMTDYTPVKAAEFMKEANDHTLIVAQIETKEAIENIDAILSVEGIDVGLIGPNDLSISLGIPDQMNSEILTKAIEKVVETAKKRGKASGIHIGSVDAIKKWRAKGMTVLACNHGHRFPVCRRKVNLGGDEEGRIRLLLRKVDQRFHPARDRKSSKACWIFSGAETLGIEVKPLSLSVSVESTISLNASV